MDKKWCFCCQGPGHYASECANKRVVTLAEYQASYEELEEENDEGEKELSMTKSLKEVKEGPNKGEMRMIRRALSGLASPNDLE